MLYAVRMDVILPPDMDPAARDDLITREKSYSQELQRAGKWPQIWRIAGQYANLSVFDVADNGELNDLLWALPLFPYMRFEVLPLTLHPSDVKTEGRASSTG
jgi:muconolactone D-isomerase